jgi:hypothetical protein
MGAKNQSANEESGIINMQELMTAAKSGEGSADTACDIEDALYSMDAEIYELRAKMRNSFREFIEKCEYLGLLFKKKAYLDAVDGKDIFKEDKLERIRDAAAAGKQKRVFPDMRKMEEKQLRRHEYVRYLRDKFTHYLNRRKFEDAYKFAEESAGKFIEDTDRAEFLSLIAHELSQYLCMYINARRADNFIEMFFAGQWGKYLMPAHFNTLVRDEYFYKETLPEIRRAVIHGKEGSGLQEGNMFRKELVRLGLYPEIFTKRKQV